MEHVEDHLKELWDVNESDRQKGIKLWQKICSNILTDPLNPKYRDLNFAKIGKELDTCQPALILLFDAGFALSADGHRLQWDLNKMNLVKIGAVQEGLIAKQQSHYTGDHSQTTAFHISIFERTDTCDGVTLSRKGYLDRNDLIFATTTNKYVQ